jgi:threonine/homoserine/homoserine lactone efflux protein
MTLLSLSAFAGAIFVLFFTPGPGNVAMVARTLDAGPIHGFIYGGGIITGDIFWLTVAITGLTALSGALGPSVWIAKVVGAGVLLWFAFRAFQSFANPQTPDRIKGSTSRLGYLATYLAGIAMPLTNPKPIVFYLSFLPAFFDLSQVDLAAYCAMVLIMLGMYAVTATVHVGLAHRARNWLKATGVKRWADALTGVIMLGVALLLLLR